MTQLQIREAARRYFHNKYYRLLGMSLQSYLKSMEGSPQAKTA